MEVKTTIVNMAESDLQRRQFDDWYQNNINEWGGIDYKLNRDSIVNDLLSLGKDTKAKVYKNGISITYLREAIVKEDYTGLDDLEVTPNEVSILYILDDGEVYYINRGFNIGFGYSNYLGIDGYEYNTDNIEKEIIEKLGKRYTLENVNDDPYNAIEKAKVNGAKVRNKIKEQLMRQKIEGLVANVKEAIKKGKYQETVHTFDPETNSLKDENQKIA